LLAVMLFLDSRTSAPHGGLNISILRYSTQVPLFGQAYEYDTSIFYEKVITYILIR
jgi:hypothetical protein